MSPQEDTCRLDKHGQALKMKWIGGYKDRLLFDITKMDACNLLFGRPWQYDLKAQHDGVKNTYKITKDGIDITLFPLKEKEEKSKGKEVKVMLMEGK